MIHGNAIKIESWIIIIIIIIKSLLKRKAAQQTCAFTIPVELNYNYND